jgi:hypothetical protein
MREGSGTFAFSAAPTVRGSYNHNSRRGFKAVSLTDLLPTLLGWIQTETGRGISVSLTIKLNRNFKMICKSVHGPAPGGRVMYPRRFARVRPSGRDADLAKLIFGPKDPAADCRVIGYFPGWRMH